MAEIKLVIDGAIKKIIGAYTVVNGQIKQLLWQSVINGQIQDFISYEQLISKTIELPENLQQSRTYTLSVDNLISVESISVNTGNVRYTINGNNINIICENGEYSRREYNSTKYSKYVTDTSTLTLPSSSTPSFPNTKSYNSDGYSGTLTKSGTPKNLRTYTQIGASKTVTDSYSFIINFVNGNAGNSIPQYFYYNSGGYSGTVYLVQDADYREAITKIENYTAQKYTGSVSFNLNYSGTVKQPDTQVTDWEQEYAGTVYSGGYDYYYKYIIDISYKVLAN